MLDTNRNVALELVTCGHWSFMILLQGGFYLQRPTLPTRNKGYELKDTVIIQWISRMQF